MILLSEKQGSNVVSRLSLVRLEALRWARGFAYWESRPIFGSLRKDALKWAKLLV